MCKNANLAERSDGSVSLTGNFNKTTPIADGELYVLLEILRSAETVIRLNISRDSESLSSEQFTTLCAEDAKFTCF